MLTSKESIDPFGLKDPADVQLVNDLLKYREAMFNRYAESRRNAEAMADAAKQKAEQDLKQQYLDIPEDVRKAGYPAIDHDFKAAAKRIEYQHQLALIDPNDAGADTRIKLLKERFPEASMKDFVDTQQYRDAVHENSANRERYTIAQNLRDQLLQMRKALDDGDVALAANIGKMGVMRTINSLQGKDIKEFGSTMSKWNDLYSKSIEADPENFYRTAAELHGAAADTIDGNVKRIIGMSSPYHAKLMQANFADRLPEFQPQSTQAGSSQFAQTAPTRTAGQGGKTTVIFSGSAQAATAQPQKPQQAPVSVGVSPETMEAIRAEMKRRGLIK